MKRREFMTAACAAGLAAASIKAAQAQAPASKPYLLDFRLTTTPNAQRMEAMVKRHGEETIPIVNKYGVSPCGIFVPDVAMNAKETGYDKKYDKVLVALVPHQSFEASEELAAKMRADTQFVEMQAAFVAAQAATAQNPMYTAQEKMLLQCIPDYPTVKAPPLTPNRILRLRMYRSHNYERNRAQIRQFTVEGGVLEIFAECGIHLVFLSQVLYGAFVPGVVFMMSFENEEQMTDAWAKFRVHPGWLKLKDDPQYADTATEVINIFLKPCKGSQV